MNDSEWLKNVQNKKTLTGAAKAPLSWAATPAEPPKAKPPPPAARQSPAMVVFTVLAIIIGMYFYFDTKQRESAKAVAAQTVKNKTPPRTITTAEIQALDARRQVYDKKLQDAEYRKEISTGIVRMNDIAERFNDMNQVAAGTARIALPQVIQQMQSLRREAAAIAPHPCLRPGAAFLTNGISEMVNGYLSFMQTRDDAANTVAKRHFEQAKTNLIQYIKQRDVCVTW